MDCVRLSTSEQNSQYFKGDYVLMTSLSGKGIDVCRSHCISDLDCQAWKYTPDGKCSFTEKVEWDMVPAPTGTQSGRVECQAQIDLLRLIWWIVIFGAILTLVWYIGIYRKGKKRRS